jgi:outer membrane protein insertion porin family
VKRSSICRIVLIGLCWSAGAAAATLHVHGTGWWRDRELRISLERLLDAAKRKAWDANAVEDAAVILSATLGEAGYQHPQIAILAREAGAPPLKLVFDPTFARPLPRTLTAEEVTFEVTPGVRSHIERVEFTGLTAISPATAEGFFRLRNTLFASEGANAYSPARMNRGADSLLADLRQLGYIDAAVRAEVADENGDAVSLRVSVTEGRKWEISAVRFQDGESDGVTLPRPENWIGKPWTPTAQVDIREATRRAYYEVGYPDVGLHVEAEPLDTTDLRLNAEVVVTIVPGDWVHVGRVRFEGARVTNEAVLRRRVEFSSGAPLNPLALERARFRLSHLGIFDAIDLRYEPEEGSVRDPVFRLRESMRAESSVLLGYGSYEQARVGFEHRLINVFGRGHVSAVQLVQSMKSTSGDYTYAVPELFGETLDGAARLFGLQREEFSFLRQEFGLNLSLKRALPGIGGDATIGYTYQALRNRRNSLSTRATDESQVNAASVNLGVVGDRRDNRLRPRQGYHWSAQAEIADPAFGGSTAYQRFEASGAYHTSWGGGRWVHVGLAHGAVTTTGSNDRTLPVNKRFYAGGDNSIRGYQRGEAAPRDADGRFVGAKAYLLLNIELEQALTPAWSVVAFVDSLAQAKYLRQYPFDEWLHAAGLGVRYQTLIGPVRLEYGRNLNPRPADPAGTWQLSLGYPF